MDKKSVKSNYALNMSYQILAIIVPFITTPYISRVLSVEQIGIFNYTFAVVNVFMNFVINGSGQFGVFEVAYHQEEKKKNTELIVNISVLRLFVLGLMLIPYAIIAVRSGHVVVYTIDLLILLGYVIDITWFFQGIEEFRKIVLRNFIIKILGVVLIFIYVKDCDDFYLYVLINAAVLFIGNISLWIGIKKYTVPVRMSLVGIKRIIKPSLVFFIPTISSILYSYLDKIILGVISTEAEVAYYSQAEKIVKMPITVITAMQAVLLPRISSLFKVKDDLAKEYVHKGIRFVFMIGMPMLFGIYVVAPYFAPLFLGRGYERSIENMQILSILIMAIGLAAIIGTPVMIPLGKQKEYNIIIVVASGMNCILDLVLIPKLGSYGASIATAFVESFITISIIYNIREYLEFKKVLKDIKLYLFAALIMFIVLNCLKMYYSISFFTVICIAIIGAVLYVLILILFRDELLLSCINNIWKKLKTGRLKRC